MTVREHSSDLLEPRARVALPEYANGGDAFCPFCGGHVPTVGTPQVPPHVFDATITEPVPVFGRRCDCRRSDVVLVAPATEAPERFVAVEATVDGDPVPVAIPEPALDEAAVAKGGEE